MDDGTQKAPIAFTHPVTETNELSVSLYCSRVRVLITVQLMSTTHSPS